MKKIILSFLSFLLIGNFCFADNTKDYKQIIPTDKNQQNMLAELSNALEQAKEENNNIVEINSASPIYMSETEQQNLDSALLNTYPEFLKTCMEKPLSEALKKNPKLEIREITSDRDYTEKTFTLSAITTSGQKIKAQCENKGFILTAMELWENPDKTTLKNYREFHKIYPKMVKEIKDYIFKKTGKKYNKHISFQCDNLIEVYNIQTNDVNEYWDEAQCMPVIYRYDSTGKEYRWKSLAQPNYYPIYSSHSLVKVNGHIWYESLTPRSNPPTFNPKQEFAPIPYNKATRTISRNLWETSLSESSRGNGDTAEGYDTTIRSFMALNKKGSLIKNNGIFPVMKISDNEIKSITGIDTAHITHNPYELGYYCGETLSTTYKDNNSWITKTRQPSESNNFFPDKSLNCKSLKPILLRRLAEVL